MGLVVVGLGLLDISFWYLLLNAVIPEDVMTPTHKLCIITTTMLTFGMGASTQALFARVGGGIYTKAADVGADLVGKVEAGIPEDDPRIPATIADNVGDNVGDVAGMGADLYESYCGSILATAALGAAAFIHSGDTLMQFKAVIAPMLIAAVGILLSIIGIFSVRTKENAKMKDLLNSLAFGTNLSSILIVVATFFILWLLKLDNWLWISCSVIVGLIVGIIIGRSTEYYTSQSYRPTQKLSESGKTGPATVIISGIGLGMLSTAIPVIAVVIGIIASYLFASGFDFSNVGLGLYGIGIAAVGMLSTLGITLATDAYGPIADNAGGNAEMSGLGEEVRKRTDALDSLGNTTAATGKGFAIGSAALTGLALLASYVEEIRIGLTRLGTTELSLPHGDAVALQDATFFDFMHHYDVTLMNPKVLSGMFLGSMMAFLFCGLTMNAVGRAAAHMVDEVRRQFREIKGILTGETEPDYERCVAISTKGAQREMVIPSLIAIIAPIATGLIFGVPGVLGLLIGGLSSGFVLAIFMANAGGAWDNAKKYVEGDPEVPHYMVGEKLQALANNHEDYKRFYHNVNGEQVRHDKVHNLFGYNMTRSAGEAFERISPDKRILMFSRSSYIGMHRYGGIWTGDNCSWWSHILLNLKMMPSLNMCGFLYTGADLGGFGANTTRDLLLRWLALGVFTPLMRNHAALGTREQEPYQFEHIEDFRNVIGVRYRLVPYLYSEYMKSSLNDDMYFIPLAFVYPDD